MARDLRSQSHRWVRRALVSAAVMALVIGVITTSTAFARSAQLSGASSAVAAAYTVRLTAVQTHTRTFFTGPHGSPQPGDHLVFQQSLFYDAAQQMPAGTAFISCTFDWSSNTACTANARLTDRGQVFLDGYVPNTPTFTIAIAGGTGEFADVRGTAVVTGAGQTLQTITLHIQS